MRRALADSTSTSHSSLAPVAGFSWLKARYFWSGDHASEATDSGCGRPLIWRSAPSVLDTSHSLLPNEKRLSETVFGLIRRPASFSSGAATWAMDGSAGVCSSAVRSRLGDRYRLGARGASTTACRAADGSR
ncbi:hypothetical protein D3C81_1245130 [compost metagenome]